MRTRITRKTASKEILISKIVDKMNEKELRRILKESLLVIDKLLRIISEDEKHNSK